MCPTKWNDKFFFFFGQEINANEHLHISSNKNYFVHTIMYIIHLLTKKKKKNTRENMIWSHLFEVGNYDFISCFFLFCMNVYYACNRMYEINSVKTNV